MYRKDSNVVLSTRDLAAKRKLIGYPVLRRFPRGRDRTAEKGARIRLLYLWRERCRPEEELKDSLLGNLFGGFYGDEERSEQARCLNQLQVIERLCLKRRGVGLCVHRFLV